MSDESWKIREKAEKGRFVLLCCKTRRGRDRRTTFEFYFQKPDDGNGPLSTTSVTYAMQFPDRLAASDYIRNHLIARDWEPVRR
jgi:hypothetical protein